MMKRAWAAGVLALASVAAAQEVVGAPMGEQWLDGPKMYARNVWDLQAFEGRIYAGYGDFSLNAGGVALTAYDPKTKAFVQERKTQEQGIFRYRVTADRLLATGNDPSGDAPSIFLREGNDWREISAPKSKHAFDALFHGGKLFVTIQEGGGRVVESADGGATWGTSHGPLDPIRTFSLFELNRILHVSSYDGAVHRYTGKGFARAAGIKVKPGPKDLPSGRTWGDSWVVHKPVNLAPEELYYVAWNVHIDFRQKLSHYNGAGLFVAVGNASQAVPLKGLAEDVVVSGKQAYAVTNEGGKGKYTIRVYAGRRGAFKEVFSMPSEAPARSLEILDGDLYLGLGCTREDLRPEAGRILRVAGAVK